ncbi:MAG: tRNA threonylcarbamoyladenosine biosynthesis protein TsaB [Myxococcota bacterium]|jgi:tRNA threonylcarbamoyladenosine biosynthesis protein TsaB
MGCVLGIDTAGPVIGAAVWHPGWVESWSARIVRKADGVLMPAIAELLASVGSIDLVAVSTGPGAFTGLRVGVSMALGIAMARDVPVVAVSSLAARAACAGHPRTLSLLDARKGRVYAGLFDASGDVPVLIGAEHDALLADILPEGAFVAVGEGALVFSEIITAAGGQVSPDAARCPADEVARLGMMMRAEALDPGDIALRYLRPPDAKVPGGLGQSIGTRAS